MTLLFRKIDTKTRLLNPFRGFSLEEIHSEIRFDPLTNESGRIFDIPFKCAPTDWTKTLERSDALFCPFCEGSIEKSTPLFPEDVISEGSIRVGEATLIPNLLPFDKYAAVCIMTRRHYIPLPEWNPETMEDAFVASQRFLREITEKDPQVDYFSVNWNYMPPSGSSIVHPHLQINCGEVPTNEHRLQLQGARQYQKETGLSFWSDFMDTEREKNERYIGEIGATFWTMGYVPRGFLPDVQCIFPDAVSLARINEEDLYSFLKGLSGVLSYFREQNIPSFNMSIFSVRDDRNFRVNARICPRLLPRPIGNSDMAYLQMLHRESFCVRPPESECPRVRDHWTG